MTTRPLKIAFDLLRDTRRKNADSGIVAIGVETTEQGIRTELFIDEVADIEAVAAADRILASIERLHSTSPRSAEKLWLLGAVAEARTALSACMNGAMPEQDRLQ